MLVFNSSLFGKPVGSLQSGHRIGEISRIIIDPHTFSIHSLGVHSPISNQELILFVEDIASFSSKGVIVQTNDNLMSPDDLVRFQEIDNLRFEVVNKQIIQEDGIKLGRAQKYLLEPKGFSIQKIYVKPKGMKVLKFGNFIVSRSQIVSVNDEEIIVRSSKEKVSNRKMAKGFEKILGSPKASTHANSSSTSE